ncbi:MAG: DUF3347 domain-containing protein [Methylacidiphilales bacterium]|nr:DUF3347 domain-containing protein [Candidatus Methylacidiphilales bacterium]
MSKTNLCFTLIFGLILLGFTSAAHAALPAPVQAVLTPYVKIHDALAKDSLDGISAAATDVEKALANDKIFPAEMQTEARQLAKAQDLVTARSAFKNLSEALIKALADNKIKPDPYVEAYCPMVDAHWLQTGTTVSNPYSSEMAHCGSIVTAEATPSSQN